MLYTVITLRYYKNGRKLNRLPRRRMPAAVRAPAWRHRNLSGYVEVATPAMAEEYLDFRKAAQMTTISDPGLQQQPPVGK